MFSNVRDEDLCWDIIMQFNVGVRYEIIEVIGHGAFGVMVKGRDKLKEEFVAILKVSEIHDVNIAKQFLRTFKCMRLLKHQSILSLKNLIHIQTSPSEIGEIYLITRFMESNLYAILRSEQELTPDHATFLIYSLLRAFKYIHSANIIHKTIRPNNILINSDCSIKICNFNYSGSNNNTPENHIDNCVNLFYRPPETMLLSNMYTQPGDIWNLGCIFAEILGRKVLFTRGSKIEQLRLIIRVLGSPCEEDLGFIIDDHAKQLIKSFEDCHKQDLKEIIAPNASSEAIDLLQKMLKFDPGKRITASEALRHPYFSEIHDSDDEPICEEVADFPFENKNLNFDELNTLLLDEIALCTTLN